MYARTSTWSGSPEALEKWALHVQQSVAPMVAGLPGNAGAYFFIDRPGPLHATAAWNENSACASAGPELART